MEEEADKNVAAEAGQSKTNDASWTRKSMSSAVWLPDKGVAEVFEQRGKLLMRMGFILSGRIHLHIEEALYLMERGQLTLYSCSRLIQRKPIPLRQAFDLMLRMGVTKDQFLVYCHLMESALIVRRHPALWNLDPKTHPSSIWGGGAWAAACPFAANGSTLEDGDTTVEPSRIQALLRRSSTDAEAAEEPSRPAKRQKVDEARPAEQQRAWWPLLPEADGETAEDPPSRGVIVEEEPSTAELEHLKPFQGTPDSEAADASPNIAFDVHKPNSRFSRKRPDPPVVHICMVKDRKPPTRAAMLAAEAASKPGAAVCYACVSHCDVALYAYEKMELPSLL